MKHILKPGRNCREIVVADDTGLIIDARDYYRAFSFSAEHARRFILISGWMFDSSVRLLHGKDARAAGLKDTGFLDFLDGLCLKNADLKVYILAWDFSLLYSLEREWMQDLVFSSTKSGRIYFRFDGSHALGASQHQKFAVVDGAAAFVGGLDIAGSRWDDRLHLASNPERVDPGGVPYKPYHDVTSYHTGAVAGRLKALFEENWKNATGDDLALPAVAGAENAGAAYLMPDSRVRIAADRVAISRTRARPFFSLKRPVREIRSLYIDAIRSANSLIYIENQYFSSYAVYRALKKRMKAPRRPRLQIVMMIPVKAESLMERISAGIAQARLLRSLKRIAGKRGHSFGIYYPAVYAEGGERVPVFVHSKLMLVDDRFLTVGSANTNNRSMGFDTELNVAWEEGDAGERRQREFTDSIRNVRVELLTEHAGLKGDAGRAELANSDGLVDYLNIIADMPNSRLRRRRMDPMGRIGALLKRFNLDRLLIDPEKAVIDEYLSMLAPARGGILARIKRWFARIVS